MLRCGRNISDALSMAKLNDFSSCNRANQWSYKPKHKSVFIMFCLDMERNISLVALLHFQLDTRMSMNS